MRDSTNAGQKRPAATAGFVSARKRPNRDFPVALVFGKDSIDFNLTPTQRRLWLHTTAATAAAHRAPPLDQYRRLGVISRCLTGHCQPPSKKVAVIESVQLDKPSRKPPAVSKSAALKLARADAIRDGLVLSEAQLAVRGEQCRVEWAQAIKTGTIEPFWDQRGGVSHRLVEQDARVVPLEHLYELLERGTLRDTQPDRTKSLYNGLQSLPTDALSVVSSLKALSEPCAKLYNCPMVVAYPRYCATTGMLEMGVYANRLLFEIMTSSLQIVMAALDDDSYTVAQPLVYPPPSTEPVFDSDDQVIVYEAEDGAQADPTMQQATVDHTTLYAYSNAGLLKLCESHGSDVSDWPAIASKLEPSLQVSLMLHQVHGVCWMYQMEQQPSINSIFWEQRQWSDGGTYWYAPALGQARLFLGACPTRPPPQVRGGILADEMGLGKASECLVVGGTSAKLPNSLLLCPQTVQVLALIVATLDELKAQAQGKVDHYHATLIVVPPALVSQWLSEIVKITGDALVVQFFNHKTLEFEPKSVKQGPPDIVVTTYHSLEKGKRSKGPFDSSCRILLSTSWGRVVLDEMQEIRSSTTSIAKNCEGLQCDRRWMLSGTPLFEGVEDFRGELCFLRLEPFAGNCDDGFFDFAVRNHWEAQSQHGLDTLRMLSLVMLRRSKTMTIRETGHPLLGLKPLTIVYEPVSQDPSERAVYCFLEYLVHALLDDDQEDATKHRSLLRLLREAGISPVLLNGGFGCSSQLGIINRMMVELNRKELTDMQVAPSKKSNDRALSCGEAIRFLSQVIEGARVDSDFVSDLTIGGGGGVTRRDRAVDSAELQLAEAKETLARAEREINTHRSKRAKANWHRMLELITTGRLSSAAMESVSPKFRSLWRWRRATAAVPGWGNGRGLPELLTRGWRPCLSKFCTESGVRAKQRWQWALDKILAGCLLDTDVSYSPSWPSRRKQIHFKWRLRNVFGSLFPSGSACFPVPQIKKKMSPQHALKWLHSRLPHFSWTHPHGLLMSGIPVQVSPDEIHASVVAVLESNLDSVRLVPLQAYEDASAWNTYVHFTAKEDLDKVNAVCRRADGLEIKTSAKLAWVEDEIKSAEEAYKLAEAGFKIYPCTANQTKLKVAKKAFYMASLGLRCVVKEDGRAGHIHCSPGHPLLRDLPPRSCNTLFTRLDGDIGESSGRIAHHMVIKQGVVQTITRLEGVMERGQDAALEALSAFETLQLMQNGEIEKTTCPICLGPLGEGSEDGIVSLTSCGHLSCCGCLNQYLTAKAAAGYGSPPCISCRKPVRRGEIQKVDPNSTADSDLFEERRQQAKTMVQQAADALEKSNGQLESHMWEALYLAIEPPEGAHRCAHAVHTAIPSVFLGHLGCATALSRDCGPYATVDQPRLLSSKIRALLADLPKSERSVVFTSSKQGVKLLMNVLGFIGIGCRGLFTGQLEYNSENAVQEWQTLDTVPVLVVQAGAAACGLTLTAASKMFIMEPFLKHEEEKQAYARLHRYGQTQPVDCKVYYAPVSVESRLLEWRKKASSSGKTEEKILYAPLRNDAPASSKDDEDDQTRFLLGLQKETSETADSSDDSEMDDFS